MNRLRRLSCVDPNHAMPVLDTSFDEKPRHRHRHPHFPHHHHSSSHAQSPAYAVSPLGGNRPFSVHEPTKVTARSSVDSVATDRKSRSRRSSISLASASSSSDNVRSEKSSRHRHRSHSRKASRRSKKSRDVESDPEDSAATRKKEVQAVGAPENYTLPRTRTKTTPSMGSVFPEQPLQQRRRAGTVDGSAPPHITQTPPTPRSRTPLEDAKRRNTLTIAEFEAGRPPYPATPPSEAAEKNTDYMTYYPQSSGHSVDQLPASLRPGPNALSAASYHALHSNAVEIGSSDSVPASPAQSRSRANTASSPRPASAASHRPSVRRPPGKEDPYDFLKEFHTVFVVDDSASMDGGDLARWNETCRALEVIADVATRYDTEGIDIYFLNNSRYNAFSIRSASAIRDLFGLVQPEGCTPTGWVLDEILREYIDSYVRFKRPSYTNDLSSSPSSSSDISSPTSRAPVKPLNIVVLTDGEPTDDPESVIVDAARQLERLNAPLHQVGIQFFQIGDEPGAKEALQELDDALAGVYNIRDMVDTTPFNGETVTGEMILKVLLGGVNRRVDRRKN